MQNLAIDLDDGRGDGAARAELATKYGTSGVAVFDVGDPWTGLKSATLVNFPSPR